MAWTGVITDAGRNMLATYAQGGHTMHIDRAAVGSGNTPTGNMRSASSLAAQKDAAAITGTSAANGAAQIRVQVSAAQDGGYQAREIGLFGHIDTGASQMIALYQDENGVSVPDVSANPDFEFGLFIAIAVSNTDNLMVNVDTAALVSVGQLNDALAKKVDKTAYDAAMAQKVDRNTYDAGMDGKVSKNGDTMTGALISTNGGGFISKVSEYGGFHVRAYNDKKAFSFHGDSRTHRPQVEVFDLANSGHGDRYMFPEAEDSLSADAWYQVLTTKKTLTIGQGGTGATTKSEARDNLGIHILCGSVSAVGTSGKTVTFEKEFSSAPNVVATGNINGNVWINNITKSGFTVSSSVANNLVRWQAVLIG